MAQKRKGKKKLFRPQTFFLKLPLSAVYLGVIALILGSVLAFLEGVGGTTVNLLVQGLVAATLLTFALAMHTGRERIAEDLPALVVLFTLAGVVGQFVPQLGFAFELGTAATDFFTGMAVVLAEGYMALALGERTLKAANLDK